MKTWLSVEVARAARAVAVIFGFHNVLVVGVPWVQKDKKPTRERTREDTTMKHSGSRLRCIRMCAFSQCTSDKDGPETRVKTQCSVRKCTKPL